jgi:hypothetical protein
MKLRMLDLLAVGNPALQLYIFRTVTLRPLGGVTENARFA